MKIKNKFLFYSVLSISLFLFISTFIPILVDSGSNYQVQDSLLGIIIFHNLFVLATIILIIFLALAKSISV